MRHFDLSDWADRDMENVASYTYIRYGQGQVRKYIQLLYAGIRDIARGYIIGRWQEGIPEGFLAVKVEKHIIVYTMDNERVRVSRILHESRDLPRHRFL